MGGLPRGRGRTRQYLIVSPVVWYRFRATFGQRWGSYLSVVVLVGLIGGIAMASIAAGRRTQSSYPTFLASTNPSDMSVSVYIPNGGNLATPLEEALAHLPDVKKVTDLTGPTFIPLAKNGSPDLTTSNDVSFVGSADGMFLRQDRLTAVEGRLADPNRADEMVMSASAARTLGVHVGQVVPLGFYTNAQTSLPGFGTPSVAPRLRIRAKLTGIVVFNNDVVQDDIDRAYGFVVLTPSLIDEAIAISPSAGAPALYGLQLDHGARDVRVVEQEIVRLAPAGSTYQFHVTSRVVTDVELAVKPESVALGGFGAIAALVCLVLGIQAISRQLRSGDEDRQVLRSLGADPLVTTGDGLIALLGAVLLGSFVAVGVAVGLSPLSPLGPVRPVYPDAGIAFDWTVLGAGLGVLVVVLGVAAVAMSYRRAPHRVVRIRPVGTGGSRFVRRAETAGMPVAGIVGVRFALEPGQGRTAVPVRSAMLGAVLAVITVVATLTFASSLRTLVANPPLYGWNWSYVLNPTDDVPRQALNLLGHDRDVAAWTGMDYNNFGIDGQTAPFLFSRPGAPVSPPILSGHGLEANNQIVLGAATLAVLHKHVGQTVSVTYGTPADAPLYVPPTRLVIVGTATFPAVGYSSFIADHTSMGTGALISKGVLPPTFQRAIRRSDPNLNGPELVFVRLRSGISPAAGRANLQHIAKVATRIFASDPNTVGDTVTVLGVQRPAQIVNYRSIGFVPVILAIGLGAGAIVALGLTLAASVRRRRRDLALLKALGFTPRQLRAAVAWQATVAAVIGIVIGMPIGIVVGRVLWTQFARNLNAVPDPTVPVLSMFLIVLGALVFANLVASLPGRDAARTPTVLLLRTE
jgi:hypothetical protein